MKEINILQYTKTQVDNDTYLLAKPNSKIIFYVNEKKRTVVCKMGPCSMDIFLEAPEEIIELIRIGMFERNLLKCVYSGKAKCAPEDSFNLIYGMELARKRMLRKYYKDRKEVSDKLFIETHTVLSYLADLYFKSINRLTSLENDN